MMTMKSKGSLLVTLGILLTVGIASLIVSSESFAEEVGQTNIGVTFYGGKEPLKTEGVIKPIEQPVYSLGIACLLVVLTSFYYLNKKRKKEK